MGRNTEGDGKREGQRDAEDRQGDGGGKQSKEGRYQTRQMEEFPGGLAVKVPALSLLWLWVQLGVVTAMGWVQSLVWERVHAVGMAKKKQKTKQKRKKRKKPNKTKLDVEKGEAETQRGRESREREGRDRARERGWTEATGEGGAKGGSRVRKLGGPGAGEGRRLGLWGVGAVRLGGSTKS